MKNKEVADGKYLHINALARRTKELARGGKPTIPYAEGNFVPVEVATEEMDAGKLIVRRRNERTGEIESYEN